MRIEYGCDEEGIVNLGVQVNMYNTFVIYRKGVNSHVSNRQFRSNFNLSVYIQMDCRAAVVSTKKIHKNANTVEHNIMNP